MTAEAPASVSPRYQARYAWVVMGVLWAVNVCAGMVSFSVGILIPVWREDLGVTPLEAGLLGSAGFTGFAVMALPASIWLTRYSPRFLTLACVVGMAVLAFVQAAAPTTTVLLISRFAFIMLVVARLQMQVMIIQQWFQSRNYATVNGLDFGSRAVGQILGLAAVPLMLSIGSWRYFFLGIGAALIGIAIAWSILGREPKRSRPSTPDTPASPRAGNPAAVLRRNKTLWIIAVSQTGAAATFASFLSFFPSYAIDQLGASLTGVGLLMGLLPVGGMVGAIMVGPASQALGRRKPFILVPGLVLPVVFTALMHVEALPVLMVLFLVAGVLMMSVPPIVNTMPYDMGLNPREVSVAVGLVRTVFPIGATAGPLLVGALQEATGSLFLGLSIVAPLAASLFLTGIFLPETGPKGR